MASAYTVLVHKGEGLYWAEVEELAGCFGSAETMEELEQDIRQAIELYLASLRDDGLPVPQGRQQVSEEDVLQWAVQVA